jgi:hypothetical protein
MILPLVVVDVHEEDAAKNPDHTLSVERVKNWETNQGRIPAEAQAELISKSRDEPDRRTGSVRRLR